MADRTHSVLHGRETAAIDANGCLVGTVLRANEDGLGFLENAESKEQFAFTFDRICGYQGESLRELRERGLCPGERVLFKVAGQKIESVELIRPQSRKTLRAGAAG